MSARPGTALRPGPGARPDPGTVHVWRIRLDAFPADRLLPLLDGRERRRAAGLVEEAARRRYVVAHGAVRLILGGLLRTPPHALRWSLGAHGKPELAEAGGGGPGLRTNLSHSGELALLAVTGGRAVGVDVEEVRPDFDAAAFAARFFPPHESALVRGDGPARPGEDPADPAVVFARLWTRKEACVKAAGGRLAQGLRLSVTGPLPGLAGLSAPCPAGGPGTSLPGRRLVVGVEVPAGFAAAVAAEGTEPYEVVTHDHR